MNYLLLMTLILLGCVGLGILLGIIVVRLGHNHDPLDDTGFVADGLSATLGTVGGLLAFVLGFLVVFTLDNYTAAQDIASQEASAYSAAFEASVLLPPERGEPIQRDLACLIDSVRTEGWFYAEGDRPTADDVIESWWVQTRIDLGLLPEAGALQEYAAETVYSSLAEARSLGEQRLLMNGSSVPGIIWIIIWLSITALVTLTYVCLRNNTFILLTSISVLTVVIGVVLWALITFANPFSTSDGTAVEAEDLAATLVRLQDTYPTPASIWDPCGEPPAVTP